MNPTSARSGRFLPHGVRQIAIGSIWLVLAAALGQGAMLLANLIVANVLGVADYGRYALLQSTVLMMAGIAQLSFALVVAQQVSTLRESEQTIVDELRLSLPTGTVGPEDYARFVDHVQAVDSGFMAGTRVKIAR